MGNIRIDNDQIIFFDRETLVLNCKFSGSVGNKKQFGKMMRMCKDELTNYTIHNFFHYREELHFYLKMLLKEVRKKEENFESICQNLLELIIWNITRQTQTTLSVAPTKKITKECRFIEQYLDEHFKEDITLQTLSDLTYLNKYYLVHAFKNYK